MWSKSAVNSDYENLFYFTLNQQSCQSISFFYFTTWSAVILEHKKKNYIIFFQDIFLFCFLFVIYIYIYIYIYIKLISNFFELLIDMFSLIFANSIGKLQCPDLLFINTKVWHSCKFSIHPWYTLDIFDVNLDPPFMQKHLPTIDTFFLAAQIKCTDSLHVIEKKSLHVFLCHHDKDPFMRKNSSAKRNPQTDKILRF